MMKKVSLCLILLVLGVFISSPHAYAELGDGIEVWGMTFRPYFGLKETYDSNVYLDDLDPKDDWMTTLDIGTDAELKLGDVLVTGGYGFNMNLFADDRHEEQNNYNHTAKAIIDWNLTDYEFVLKDTWRRFSDRSGTEDTSRVARWNNLLSGDAIARFNKLEFDLGYDLLREDYISDDISIGLANYDATEDRFKHTWRGEASYRFMPKTSVLAEGSLGLIQYDEGFNPGSYYIQGLGGLRGEVWNNADTEFKVGFRYQDYETEWAKDFTNVVAQGHLTKPLGDKDAVTLAVERSVNESTYADVNYYVLNYLGLAYAHKFNDKLTGNIAGSYQLSLYPKKTTEGGVTAKRWDNFYDGSCSLKYDIQKWLVAELMYQYKQRDSKFPTFDYIDNLITLSGLIQF